MIIFVQSLLRIAARAVLRKYRPRIVGITGSVGKTSAKEATAAVLATRFRVGTGVKNYNNAFGVPLAILGAKSGNRSLIGWLRVFGRALHLLLVRSARYPELLVLEMGADRPGDIAYLTRLAPCHVGVLTAISYAHSQYLGALPEIQKEKATIITHLAQSATAVLNADDPLVLALAGSTRASVLTYGLGEHAQLRAVQLRTEAGAHAERSGIFCSFAHGDTVVPVFLPNALGLPHVSAALAAAAAGLACGLNLVGIARALANTTPLPGRMRLLPGIKQTRLIDDTYNASPAATAAALDALAAIPDCRRRIAVLSTMAELGAFSDAEHARVGEHVQRLGIDVLITVGAEGRKIGDAATARGMSTDRVFAFDTSSEAGAFLQDRMAEGDCVLIKGSESARMEKIVKEVMAEPERATELLVRQDARWLRS